MGRLNSWLQYMENLLGAMPSILITKEFKYRIIRRHQEALSK